MHDTTEVITVRPATEADLDAIVGLLVVTAAEGRWIATQTPVDQAKRRAGFVQTLQREDARIFVATVGALIVGHVGITTRRVGLLEFGMAVAADWRGKGVGTALLLACIAWARAIGAHKIVLEVFPHNAAARALYRKCGFVEEGYFRHHVRRKSGEFWDIIAMGLVL